MIQQKPVNNVCFHRLHEYCPHTHEILQILLDCFAE